MATIAMQNPSSQIVGYYDTDTKIYSRAVDWAKDQAFKVPKLRGNLAVSRSIIKQLSGLKCEKFSWHLANYKYIGHSCYIIITFLEFMNHAELINYGDGKGKLNSDEQYQCNIKHWTIIERDQSRIGDKEEKYDNKRYAKT